MKFHFFSILLSTALFTSCASAPRRDLASARNSRDVRIAENEDNSPEPDNSLDQYIGFFSNADYTPVTDMIKAARSSLDIEIYEMEDQDFRAALHGALDKGVTIRIVKEPKPLGATCDLFPSAASAAKSVSADCQAQRDLIAEIKQKGGSVIPFEKSQLCGKSADTAKPSCFEHGKMVIVDEQIALLSTGNFNSSNLCNLNQNPKTCNRDFSYVTNDKNIIDGLLEIFDKDLEATRYDWNEIFAKYPDFSKKITVSPFSSAPLIAFVDSATSSLQIHNQYMKDPNWNESIKRAAQRGVKIEMTLASECSFGPPKQSEVAGATDLFTSLESSGVGLKFMDASQKIKGRNAYMHAKAIVVDGKSAWIGSVNGSTMSLNQNREYGIFFDNSSRVKSLSDIMHGDFTNGQAETWQESIRCLKDNPDHQSGGDNQPQQ